MANFSFQGFRNLRAAFNRRDLFRKGGILTMAGAVPPSASAALDKAMGKPTDGTDHSALYEAIGVRPIINARGTFTILTGSQSLPQVKDAMVQASRSYVQMDELMAGVSKKLAELTGAPWGIVTAGCCAALTNFTAAVIAGTNPERMQRLPNLEGLKNEVIIPEYSRNVYDHAIRMLGVKIVEVKTPAELESAFNDTNRPDLHLRWSRRRRTARDQSCFRHCAAASSAGHCRRGRRRPHLPESSSSARRHCGCVQRRQVYQGSTGSWTVARRQESARSGMGEQCAAPCVRPITKGWQRRNHGNAGRG